MTCTNHNRFFSLIRRLFCIFTCARLPKVGGTKPRRRQWARRRMRRALYILLSPYIYARPGIRMHIIERGPRFHYIVYKAEEARVCTKNPFDRLQSCCWKLLITRVDWSSQNSRVPACPPHQRQPAHVVRLNTFVVPSTHIARRKNVQSG